MADHLYWDRVERDAAKATEMREHLRTLHPWLPPIQSKQYDYTEAAAKAVAAAGAEASDEEVVQAMAREIIKETVPTLWEQHKRLYG